MSKFAHDVDKFEKDERRSIKQMEWAMEAKRFEEWINNMDRKTVVNYITKQWAKINHQNPNDNYFAMFKHIWFASTELLSGLEVQVVIDGDYKIHVSSGTAGYVDFPVNPVGMKLPIKLWVHTHPFGSAYFSGTDWRTVNTWQPLMEQAFVLGGENHYGFWHQREPNTLLIHHSNGRMETQTQHRREEE